MAPDRGGQHIRRGELEMHTALQQRAHTPVRVDRRADWLGAYGDKRVADVLRRGFSKGFRLGYKGTRVRGCADGRRI